MSLLDGSGVNREIYAPFCERLKVKFLRPTYQQDYDESVAAS